MATKAAHVSTRAGRLLTAPMLLLGGLAALAGSVPAGAEIPPPACSAFDTPIGTVQGNGSTSPLAGQTVTIQGTVVGDYEYPGSGPTSSHLRGFYLQDGGDGDSATSDGIFVFQSNDDDVSLGDVVQVTGVVAEFQDQTQLNSGSTIEQCGETGTVAPTAVTMPFSSLTDLERYEGMLVTFPQELSVTEHFQLGRFGQVVVSSGGRLPQPTNIVDPGPPAAAQQAANDLSRIIVDDDLQQQNPDPIKLGRGGNPLSASNTLRGGDTVTNLTGVLTYTWAGNAASGNAYRVRPFGALEGQALFEDVNPWPDAPPVVGGSLQVSAFNVLNYFVTLDTGFDLCGPLNNQECRGADSDEELKRQRDKLVQALSGLDADVLGLIELENSTGVDPLNDPTNGIVPGLNDLAGAGTYAGIDTGVIGTDAIRVGLIYKRGTVKPVRPFEIIDASDDDRFRDDLNRPVLVQTFEEYATGERFTVAVHHLKSKGSDCNAEGDFDLGDGQGNCNGIRTQAAEAVVDVLQDLVDEGRADPDILIMGDLNSYAKEDPVTVFRNAGYVNLIERFGGADAYSYVFDGQWGSLDHALASPSLAAKVSGAAEWHINADEPSVLDYNVEFKSADQLVDLYAPDQFRTSDHDPVLVGLELGTTAAGPSCHGQPATVYVAADGTVVGGPLNGRRYRGALIGTAGDDVIMGTEGRDIVTALAGDDLVCGGDGNDTVEGGLGRDTLDGEAGNDILLGGLRDDVLVGGPGNDTLVGGFGQDTADGGEGTDWCSAVATRIGCERP